MLQVAVILHYCKAFPHISLLRLLDHNPPNEERPCLPNCNSSMPEAVNNLWRVIWWASVFLDHDDKWHDSENNLCNISTHKMNNYYHKIATEVEEVHDADLSDSFLIYQPKALSLCYHVLEAPSGLSRRQFIFIRLYWFKGGNAYAWCEEEKRSMKQTFWWLGWFITALFDASPFIFLRAPLLLHTWWRTSS